AEDGVREEEQLEGHDERRRARADHQAHVENVHVLRGHDVAGLGSTLPQAFRVRPAPFRRLRARLARTLRRVAFVATGAKRLVDDRPVHAQVVVTYACNLTCAYCTEYADGAPLVPLGALVRRIDALAALGAFT